MSESLHRSVGQVEGRIAALERKVDGLEERIDKRLQGIDYKLERLNEVMVMGKGSWKTFAVLGAIITTLIAVSKFVLSHLSIG